MSCQFSLILLEPNFNLVQSARQANREWWILSLQCGSKHICRLHVPQFSVSCVALWHAQIMGKSLLNLELKIIIMIQDSPKLPESFSGCMRVKTVRLPGCSASCIGGLDLIISDLLKVRAFFWSVCFASSSAILHNTVLSCFTSKMASESRLKPGDRRVIY